MLVFNPKRIFRLRGIERPSHFLCKNGLVAPTVHKLLNGKTVHFKIAHLEKICRLLNCTPNDLFEWKSDEGAPVAENHALNTLQRRETTQRLTEIIKDIPIERFSEVENLLTDLKNR
jgi:hypothetical protein